MEKIGTPLFLENFENLTAPFLKGGGSGGGGGGGSNYTSTLEKCKGGDLSFHAVFHGVVK